jgi:hypothetical protein
MVDVAERTLMTIRVWWRGVERLDRVILAGTP